MMEGIREIDPAIPETCFPPILTLLVTVCTADLMAGMGSGCLVYTLMVLASRQWSKLSPMLLGIDAVFLLYFVAMPNGRAGKDGTTSRRSRPSPSFRIS